MCGIAGLWNIRESADRGELVRRGRHMAQAIAHRGPDSDGVWIDEGNEISPVLVHRRLAILDLSADGAQPMHSASGRYCLVYNGEIYNYQDLKSELEGLGHSFRGFSDTEVFLGAIDQWGLNLALQKINGMFAIALWDKQKKELHLIRDRMGKKPLYVGWVGSTLVFASELKVFHTMPEFNAAISQDGLSNYFSFGYVCAPRTIYQDVVQLLPASRMSISVEAKRSRADLVSLMQPYWRPEDHIKSSNQDDLDDIATTDQFEELLTECVSQRMVSDVPLGAFLSGGLDSSCVVAIMQKISSQPVQTFTIGFHDKAYNEAAHAKDIAAHLGTDHHEMYLDTKQAMDVIPLLPQIFDEPFADASQIPTYLVSQFTKKHVTVALSGDGGDEILGGYNRHLSAPAIWKKMRYIPSLLRPLMASILKNVPAEKWPASIREKHPQFEDALPKLLRMLSCRNEKDLYLKLLGQSRLSDRIVLNNSRPDYDLASPVSSFIDKLMYWDSQFYLPNDVLTKVDRTTMAVSLEGRAPLLDYKLYEYCWNLPLSMKIRDGQGKWLLRSVLSRYVPRELFERPKQGFSVPIADWLRGDLREWAESLLNPADIRADGLLDPSIIMRMWQEHLQGRANHAEMLWNVLMFQAWKQRWG